MADETNQILSFLEQLKSVATPKQVSYIEALEKYGRQKEAALSLGVSHQTFSAVLRNAKIALLKVTEPGDALVYKKPLGEPLKILVIPDSQVKANVDISNQAWIGRYIVAKKPDIIVDLGDFADMESLSSYDKGKRSYEGRRYKTDIEAAHTAMKIRMAPIHEYNAAQKAKRGGKVYNPKLYMLHGNHEDRINRAVNIDPMLYGTISTDDLKYKEFGWTEILFLEVLNISGIAFSHYFTTGAMGRPAGTAQAMLNKKHMSCICGHQQGRQSASGWRADGKQITAIICGSSYLHTEKYLGPQGNRHWRGVIMLHNVEDGEFDEVYVPLSYLKRKFGVVGEKFIYCPVTEQP